MHVIIVACPRPLSWCILCTAFILHINIVPSFPVLLHIYTALVSLLFGTVIPTSFNILMEMFLLPCFTVFC